MEGGHADVDITQRRLLVGTNFTGCDGKEPLSKGSGKLLVDQYLTLLSKMRIGPVFAVRSDHAGGRISRYGS